MIPFDKRLRRILQVGNLRVADLARWYDRRHSTVSGWVNGNAVTGAPLDVALVERQTSWLDVAIIEHELPLPQMPASRRLQLLTKLKGKMERRFKAGRRSR